MKILLSPSKSQDFTKITPRGYGQKPEFLNDTKKLHKVLKSKSPAQLGKLMSISAKLSNLNYDRFQNWSHNFKMKVDTTAPGEKEFLPAIYAFTGDVYSGFTLDKYTRHNLAFADKTVRIISGFYGVLEACSFIKPYRLEMSTKLEIGKSKNLYGFWGSKLTDHLNKELKKNEIVLNLASVEYSSAIDREKIKGDWIDVDFKINKEGKTKVIAIYAKKARGEMANWCVLNRCKTKEDLMKFSENGWKLSKRESEDKKLVFIKRLSI